MKYGIRVSWTDFKVILDNGTPFQEMPLPGSVRLIATDGDAKFQTIIHTDGDMPTEYADYQANYQANKNKPVQTRNEEGLTIIAPTFEDAQGLTTVWKGRIYTATAGALNIFDELVTTQLKVRGGWYELLDNKAVINDYLEFAIVDKDDVLGLFAAYGLTVGQDVLELKKFVRTEYINPMTAGQRQDFESNGASTVYAGLYMRVYYNSTGSEDVKFKIMEKYHEI